MPREACVGNWMLRSIRSTPFACELSRPGRAPFDKYALGIWNRMCKHGLESPGQIWNRMCKHGLDRKPRPKGSKHPKALGLTCTYTHMSVYLAYIYIYIYFYIIHIYIYILHIPCIHVHKFILARAPSFHRSLLSISNDVSFFSRHIYIGTYLSSMVVLE